MNFNTVYPTLHCPACNEVVDSGVGFSVGALTQHAYKIGDELNWQTKGDITCRPAQKPPHGNIKTVGYFNCDNTKCPSWQDCFPVVQLALIEIKDNKIVSVEVFDPPAQVDEFAIVEMD